MLQKVLDLILKLGVIPRGWLTYLAGFAALVIGLACASGAGDLVPGLSLPCPDDPWVFILGGAGVIGFRRALNK